MSGLLLGERWAELREATLTDRTVFNKAASFSEEKGDSETLDCQGIDCSLVRTNIPVGVLERLSGSLGRVLLSFHLRVAPARSRE